MKGGKVIKCDIKGLEGLLRNGANYINEQDSNGWTILHLSCSFCFNQTRLEVCKYLLEMEEMDPLIVNNYGNIALHYLVRLPIKEHEKPLFIQVIKMMLRHSSTVFIANNRVHFSSSSPSISISISISILIIILILISISILISILYYRNLSLYQFPYRDRNEIYFHLSSYQNISILTRVYY